MYSVRNQMGRRSANGFCLSTQLNRGFQREPCYIKEDAEKIVRFGFNLLNFYSDISKPFIPVTSRKIKNCLNMAYDEKQWPNNNELVFSDFRGGEKFSLIENLFSKLNDEQIAELEEKFGGG